MTKFFKSNGLTRIHGHQTISILFTFFPSTTQLVRIFTSITKARLYHGITYEQILGPSYGPVLQNIVNDIQQK